jgi:hypothetical protein
MRFNSENIMKPYLAWLAGFTCFRACFRPQREPRARQDGGRRLAARLGATAAAL